MLRGLPASGKSTYAKELVAEGWKRVNKDELRAMIDNGKWSKLNEAFVLDMRNQVIRSALMIGMDVVVDDTNFAPIHEETLKSLANMYNAEFEIKDFDIHPTEAVKRDALRGDKSVGSKVIWNMYNQFILPNIKKIEQNPMLPRAYIVDIDGTLTIKGDRSPYDWSKVSIDTVNTDVADIVHHLRKTGAKILLLSGRDEVCRSDTFQWLLDNDIDFDGLIMRPKDDSRKDYEVKEEMYFMYIKDQYNVLGVFDDRDQVVKMWRSKGLTCLQVNYGDF